MRPIGLLSIMFTGLVVVACDDAHEGDEILQYRSEMAIQARGLALYEDGESGSAGMWDTTCEFFTEDGVTSTDLDVPGDDDELVDASATALDRPAVLISNPNGTFIGFPGDYSDPKPIKMPGVLDAEFIHGGLVTLSSADSCQVSWGDDQKLASLVIPNEICDAPNITIDSDFDTGLVIIGSDSDGAIVSPDDITLVEDLGDLIAWDAGLKTVYASDSGSTVVRGHGVDGGLLWQTDVGEAVVSLDDLGPKGAVMVMVEQGDGTGKVLILDGKSGDLLTATPTPSAAKLHVADNGKIAAMILPYTVHFYDVRLP